MGLKEDALKYHSEKKGKIEIRVKTSAKSQQDLTLAYTPGVADVCKEIVARKDAVYDYTLKWNSVAVVSDGTRVLGLGDIGPLGSLPVMEGKALLFKAFGGVDAFPLPLNCKDEDAIVETVKRIEPAFGGINLEDIESPKCFAVERRLKEALEIPVFHDDQHGTAVVVLAGLINSLKFVGKKKNEVRVVVNGAGAAGSAIARLLHSYGFSKMVCMDSKGVINFARKDLPDYKRELAEMSGKEGEKSGGLAEVLRGADILVSAAKPNIVTKEMVKSMANKAILFPLNNPEPEILPKDALEAGAVIVGTARSDYPNQVNNVLGFPGIFRGALDVRAKRINEEMKVAASLAIASLVSDEEISRGKVMPDAWSKKVGPRVAGAVAEAAVKSGVARIRKSAKEEEEYASKIIEKQG
ncbi:NAD-dependent malic enzyme [Candidatus Gugararchaeum adminiculabundum]|nr:NAD-dependent malic enzyme [Candidatus Gugararchaeum adminiculabundum]